MLSWETPKITGKGVDKQLLTETCWAQLVKYVVLS